MTAVRRLILPGILLVLLLATFQMSRVSAGWQFVVPEAGTNSVGSILYATGFDDVSDEWDESDDGQRLAQMQDSKMQLALDNANDSVYAPLRWRFADFDLQVQATTTGGVENNGFGVIFRQQDRQNYYYFLISSDGYYEWVRVLNGVTRTMSQWIPSPAVKQGTGASNTIRVVGQGDQFRFYVNGQPVAMCIPDDPNAQSTYDELRETCLSGQMLEAVQDNSLLNGRVGVIALSLNDADVQVAFDNLVVMGPEAD